jgi:hypothetical protein
MLRCAMHVLNKNAGDTYLENAVGQDIGTYLSSRFVSALSTNKPASRSAEDLEQEAEQVRATNEGHQNLLAQNTLAEKQLAQAQLIQEGNSYYLSAGLDYGDGTLTDAMDPAFQRAGGTFEEWQQLTSISNSSAHEDLLHDEIVVTADHMTPLDEMIYDISNPQILLDKNYHRPGAQWTRDFANSYVDTGKAQWNGISSATQNLYAKTNGVGNVMAPMYKPLEGFGALVGNTIGLVNVAIDPNSKISQQVENYWGSKLDSIKSLGGLLYDTAHGDPVAAGQVAFGATEAAVVGLATRGVGALGAAEDASLLVSKGTTPLSYDISKWGEYGLPSDGYFVRTLNERQAFNLSQGKTIEFGGMPTDGYQNGMGFIGSAEEVRNISTGAEYASKLDLTYQPKYLLEFQLKDPAGLRNVLDAPYEEFVRGGKTASGKLEWNYPGINSGDITNWNLRGLE